jgi:hypothetical protein
VSFNQGALVGPDIFAQVYNARGHRIRLQRRINQRAAGNQGHPAVTGLQGDGFVVAWTRFNKDFTETDVRARRFTNTGAAASREFRVNRGTANSSSRPALAGLPDDGFVIAWQSENRSFDIMAQRYRADGRPAGGEFRLNRHRANSQTDVVLAPVQNGFVAAWGSLEQGAGGSGIFGRIFDLSADPTTPREFRVNTSQAGNQILPSIAGSPDNRNFTVIWEGGEFPNTDIFGQRFLAPPLPPPP